MESIYMVASGSASVAYGNISQHVIQYVKKFFPSDFFNYEHISSEIAYRNIRRQLGANTRASLSKRTKPYLVISPILQAHDEMFRFGTPFTTNFDHIEQSVDSRNLLPIVKDTEEGIGLSFKLNRNKMEFKVTIIVSTLFQQIDIYNNLFNIGVWDRPHAIKLPLEYMIPRGIIAALAGRQNMDISKETYAANIFLDYINRHSLYPITYKMRNSSSRDEYFMYTNQNIIFTLSDLQMQEGGRKNMADDSFQIDFMLTAEFNLPGAFFLWGSPELKASTMERIEGELVVPGDLAFPLFTIENLFMPADLDNGFKRYTSSIMAMEPDKVSGNDITDFGPLLGEGFQHIVRTYVAHNINIDTLAILRLYKNNTVLEEGKDYSVDWYKMTLTTFKPDMEGSYRLVMYVNTIKLNELLVEYQDQVSKDKPKLTTN